MSNTYPMNRCAPDFDLNWPNDQGPAGRNLTQTTNPQAFPPLPAPFFTRSTLYIKHLTSQWSKNAVFFHEWFLVHKSRRRKNLRLPTAGSVMEMEPLLVERASVTPDHPFASERFVFS